MNVSEQSIRIAAAVIAKAQIMDHRMRQGNDTTDLDAQILAWAECFEGQPVWPHEALDAVAAHYRKPNPFPIMPGDVLTYCATQPPHSSLEHVQDFIDEWRRFPASTILSELSGVPLPDDLWDEPDHTRPFDRDAMRHRYERWIAENRGLIAQGILNSNGNRKALNQ